MLSYVYFGTNDLGKAMQAAKGGDPHEPGHRRERTGVSYSLVC
jgi:hypothetical protein